MLTLSCFEWKLLEAKECWWIGPSRERDLIISRLPQIFADKGQKVWINNKLWTESKIIRQFRAVYTWYSSQPHFQTIVHTTKGSCSLLVVTTIYFSSGKIFLWGVLVFSEWITGPIVWLDVCGYRYANYSFGTTISPTENHSIVMGFCVNVSSGWYVVRNSLKDLSRVENPYF